MLGMLKRHEIKVLLKAGHSQAEVAKLAGVSLRSVKRVAKEEAIDRVDDAAERLKREIGRPSLVQDFRKPVTDLLEKEPNLLSVEVLRRMRLEGYQGQKSALYALIASVRPKDARVLVRFEGLPGEFSQHDFGQVDVEYLDGSTERIRFFASRLKYSRVIRVSLVSDEAVETLVRNFADHLHSWGGAPLMSVFDRPKTVALKWQRDGVVTEWNSTFAYAALEIGVGVDVCWPYRPQEKGSVENLVGFVKGSFFKQRRFHDRADLVEQLADWHREVNDERPCRATGVIPAVRLAEELPRLRPLKVLPENLALRIPVYVGPTGTIVHDTHPYSMPPEAIGISGTLYLYRDRVRIVAGRFDVTHERKFKRGEGSTHPDHRAALVAAVSGKRAKRYLKRQQLLDLGEPALAYLTEVVHRRPKEWIRDVDQLHELLQLHGPDRLRGAFEHGLRTQVFGASHVERALQLQGSLFTEGLIQ
jgi:transposase